jgi:hypothetical protein
MNLFNLYNKPEEMHGYENRFRIPELAYEWCKKHGRNKEAERYLVTSPRWAYNYACDVIKGRWPEGEAVITTDPVWAYCYAIYVIKDRWPEAEAVIATNSYWASTYARDVIKGPWPEAGIHEL